MSALHHLTDVLPFCPRPGSGTVGDPLSALIARRGTLAVITGVEGPSYRPVGAAMALFADGGRLGSLSSGCIEADLARHAEDALRNGRPALLRYGRGSPWFDIQLPCGGGLEIMLLPAPDPRLLAEAARLSAARQVHALSIAPDRGLLYAGSERPMGWERGLFHLRRQPEPRFLIFGAGPEALVFAGLVHSAHFPALLASHDPETLEQAEPLGIDLRRLSTTSLPPDIPVDRWSNAVLFYHDHDREPPLLRDLLATPARYIGAQGSRRARDTRLEAMRQMGVSDPDLARLRGPIGLIPSTRDPRTLAVSVLAEILSEG